MSKDKNMNNNSQDNEIKVINANPETAPEKETPEVNLSTVQPEPQPPVYEDYESHEVAKKPKKRFKKRYLVIGAAVIALGVFGYAKYNASKNVVVFVETKETTLGTIENILSISGTVQSAETKTYFSKVAAPISEVSVKVGDKVSAGDTLITYDTMGQSTPACWPRRYRRCHRARRAPGDAGWSPRCASCRARWQIPLPRP